MRLFRKQSSPHTVEKASFPSIAAARDLILARLAHRAGPTWPDLHGDPLSWLEQVYYDLQDEASRVHFHAAIAELLLEPGARWAALILARTLHLDVTMPALGRLAATDELRGQVEGPCGDLQLYLIVALDALNVVEAVPFLAAQLDEPAYAVPACLTLLRMAPERAIDELPRVARASSDAAEREEESVASVGMVLAAALRDRDRDTFMAMIRRLTQCERTIRLHVAESLRRQSELEVHPRLEAEARRLLLHEARDA